MCIFCTSYFLQFKLYKLNRGRFSGVTILTQLSRDINQHTCSHLPFYYLASQPVKLWFAQFIFIMHWLLLIICFLPSVWVDWGERPWKFQGPSLKGKPTDSLWRQRPGHKKRRCVFPAWATYSLDWCVFAIVAMGLCELRSPATARALRKTLTVLCTPRAVPHILKWPLMRAG